MKLNGKLSANEAQDVVSLVFRRFQKVDLNELCRTLTVELHSM